MGQGKCVPAAAHALITRKADSNRNPDPDKLIASEENRNRDPVRIHRLFRTGCKKHFLCGLVSRGD